ncbi:DUF4249 domain-containing protein [Chryseobacterium sp. SN22]|uniref:DUF4249 domain-containing protein n=1 Tax=Chryseobacterium sp. SN22 TaxID=2606431 RepID=UPI0011F03F67|nr:DUF4249 domain-containing protein [Chryseobacterium sp. SN22]KAA0129667.1 DUF4249 domain-containing protein [Chryseobacterium sp. SN22]
MKNLFLSILSLLFLTSCEKDIDLDLDDQSGKIVIEGNITDGGGPYLVKITKSVPYSSSLPYTAIENAQVVVSDNAGQAETLTYAGDGYYVTNTFTAQPGRTYTLKVNAEGQQYSARSTMPQPVSFDGLDQDSFLIAGETTYTLLPVFTDPPALGNRYLFIYSVNNGSQKFFAEFSDNVNNGLPNQRPLLMPNDEDGVKVNAGDTIHVEMQCIDQNIFTYYSALLQILDGGAGSGITPANPPGNISNGALGYFSAHTVNKKDKVIQ